jgi:TolA-binding protein
MEVSEIYGMTFAALVLILVTIVTVVVIWQGLTSWRAVKIASQQEAYRKLAESFSETAHELRRQQEKMARDVAELRDRSERIEQLLKQVE